MAGLAWAIHAPRAAAQSGKPYYEARSEANHDSRLNLTLWKSLSSHLSHLAQEFYPFFDNFVLLCRAR